MEISESKRNGVVVIRLKGRLDASNAGEFEQKLLALIAAGHTRLVIDCEPLEYISSAGLGVLLAAAKRLRSSNGQVALAALKEQIQEVFDIAGFSAIFEVHRSLDEAVAVAG